MGADKKWMQYWTAYQGLIVLSVQAGEIQSIPTSVAWRGGYKFSDSWKSRWLYQAEHYSLYCITQYYTRLLSNTFVQAARETQ